MANLIGSLLVSAVLWFACAAQAGDESGFLLNPIGEVRKDDGKTRIVLEERYQPGLLRLDDFSHVWVIWWFDRNDNPEMRGILQVHPRRDERNPLSGVFSTRSPVRPNLVGLSLCRIVSVQGNVVEVDAIDAFPGTPVLDMKPYVPMLESVPDARTPHRY